MKNPIPAFIFTVAALTAILGAGLSWVLLAMR